MQQKTIQELRALTVIETGEVYYSTDPGKEGFWKYDTSDVNTADNTGTVLITSAPAPSYRLKRVINDCIKPEWFGIIDGTNDAEYLQRAINASKALRNSGFTYPVKSDSSVFNIDRTIFIDRLSLLQMPFVTLNAIPSPAESTSDFTDKTMLKVSGGNLHDYNYTNVILNGNNIEGLIGVRITSLIPGGSAMRFLVRNLDLGVLVEGNVERQVINVHCAYCKVALREQAIANVGTATQTPNENYYHINGSYCDTWFHQVGSASSQVVFNCEQTNDGVEDYAIVIEGNYNCRLMGEIRASRNGGIRINALTLDASGNFVSGSSLNVQLDMTLITVYKKPALFIENCRTVSGTLVSELTTGGGVYLGSVSSGTLLNLNLNGIEGGPALQIGGVTTSSPVNRLFRSGTINLMAGPMRDTSPQLLIRNADGVIVVIGHFDASSTGIQIDGTARNTSIEVNSRFIRDNIPFISNQAITLKVGGTLTSTELSNYQNPYAGMFVYTVTDRGYNSAAFDGTNWVYNA